METNHYVPGQPVRVKVTVKLNDVLTNAPQTITVRKPDGTLVSPAPVAQNDGVGLYSGVVPAADNMLPGTYSYRFDGTGAAAGAAENAYVVDRSRVL